MDAVRLVSVGICFMVTRIFVNRCEAWSNFRTCLDDIEEFRIELRTFACIWNQSELRTFECMSAFEVIQECEHLNAKWNRMHRKCL